MKKLTFEVLEEFIKTATSRGPLFGSRFNDNPVIGDAYLIVTRSINSSITIAIPTTRTRHQIVFFFQEQPDGFLYLEVNNVPILGLEYERTTNTTNGIRISSIRKPGSVPPNADPEQYPPAFRMELTIENGSELSLHARVSTANIPTYNDGSFTAVLKQK